MFSIVKLILHSEHNEFSLEHSVYRRILTASTLMTYILYILLRKCVFNFLAQFDISSSRLSSH